MGQPSASVVSPVTKPPASASLSPSTSRISADFPQPAGPVRKSFFSICITTIRELFYYYTVDCGKSQKNAAARVLTEAPFSE